MARYTIKFHITGVDIVSNYTGEVLLSAHIGHKLLFVRDRASWLCKDDCRWY